MSALTGTRISITEVAERLTAQILVNPPTIGTCYQSDFMSLFAKTFPAVWVVGARSYAKDDGRGYVSLYRQHLECEIALRLVVRRYDPAAVESAEDRLQTLHDQVAAALLGWTPTGAVFPLTWKSYYDGPSSDAIIVADMILATQVAFSRQLP